MGVVGAVGFKVYKEWEVRKRGRREERIGEGEEGGKGKGWASERGAREESMGGDWKDKNYDGGCETPEDGSDDSQDEGDESDGEGERGIVFLGAVCIVRM